jgi:phosphohistidine phosphatase SixA
MAVSAEARHHNGVETRGFPTRPFRVLLRHADAGIRAETSEPDSWRPLTPLGWAQANGLVGRLRDFSVLRVFAAPALRCRQTVVPLARALSVDVEPRTELAIEGDPHRLMDFLRDTETESAVLCSHRENLELLFALTTGGRSGLVDGSAPMTKAAAWIIDDFAANGRPRIRYLSPGSPSDGQPSALRVNET